MGRGILRHPILGQVQPPGRVPQNLAGSGCLEPSPPSLEA